MDRVTLWSNNMERDSYDHMANLFAIIKTAEALEKAYSRDLVDAASYRTEMCKLIAHYRSAREATRDLIPNMPQFLVDFQLPPGAGYQRLEAGFPSVEKSSNPKIILQATQNFITLMDSLKLEMTAIDQIQPILSDLLESIHKCTLDPSFSAEKLEAWLKRVNQMGAAEELDKEASRQMLFELTQSYDAFHKALH